MIHLPGSWSKSDTFVFTLYKYLHLVEFAITMPEQHRLVVLLISQVNQKANNLAVLWLQCNCHLEDLMGCNNVIREAKVLLP